MSSSNSATSGSSVPPFARTLAHALTIKWRSFAAVRGRISPTGRSMIMGHRLVDAGRTWRRPDDGGRGFASQGGTWSPRIGGGARRELPLAHQEGDLVDCV
jgi:hypothetical protein